ncbi:MAG: glycine oxidase ThiO [Gemmatimonadetes bacterium]|nr:glycine oxidase ThiO [Gemmatimonadota bacterium]
MASRHPDILVVGAGLIGCAAARLLTSAGFRVLLIDRGRPCREASWAAGGMLAAHYEAGGGGPLLELCLRSRAMYPDFVAALRDETGIDAELVPEGTIVPVFGEEEARQLEPIATARAGARVERLDAAAVRGREPSIHEACLWGLYLPDDVRVDNRRLCEAVVASLEARRVPFLLGRPVAAVLHRGGSVTGARLAGGEEIPAGAVLVAAGAWSGQMEGLPRPIPVEPRRGQIVLLGMPAGAIRHTILAHIGVYLVPRTGGHIVVGSTVERVGFDSRVTADGVASLITKAQRVVPQLGDAEFVEAWAGLRPATPDDLPILGPDPEVRGLLYATGHFRSGILLAPVTAQMIVEALTSQTPSRLLEPFRPERFA